MSTFVGRERELAELVSACASGADNVTHLFLISGEPGIGKTRLADELAARVKARGLEVLWGRCWEGDGAPAYWPWIQVIRSFLGAVNSERRRTLVEESEVADDVIHRVAQIVPDLRRAQSSLPEQVPEKLEPNEARFRLFDAVTNFLKIGARSHPMLIVLDDLHDADEASLALLRFMARELKAAPIMIVATYREVEVRRSPSLSKKIGELSREAHSIPLGGLSESEVTKLVELRSGRTTDQGLVAKICAATNGNPLFVDGIVRMLIAEGAIGSAGALDRPLKIPSGVHEAIRGLFDGLSPGTNSILAAAAAIGNEFEFSLCQSVVEVSADEAHRLLDDASSAGIVTALGHGRYRFSHALVRGAVYDELDTNRRILIHRKIANRLEEIYREDIDADFAGLAHHFREAEVAEKAIDYSVRAGEAANAVFAFTDAMMHLRAALDLMEQQGSNARRRADLMGMLGNIAYEIDHATAVQYLESAVALYESIGCFDEAAPVHSRLGRSFSMSGHPDFNAALAREHFRRAESALTKGPKTPLLSLLYARIALFESQRMDLVQTAAAARRAMEISDRLGDKGFWPDAAAGYATSLVMSGQLKDGFLLFDQAYETSVQTNKGAFATAWLAGEYCSWLGDPRGARAWFERELHRPINAYSPFRRQILSFLSDNTYLEELQLDEARRRLGSKRAGIRFWLGGEWEAVAILDETAAEGYERTGDRGARFRRSVFVGGTYHLLGEYGRAEAHLLYGLDNGDRGPVVLQEMRARPLLARVYVAMNRLDAAAEQVARCRQIMAAGEDWRGRAGDVALAEAVVAAARGNYIIAYRQFESALAIHRMYQLSFEEASTLQCWGKALAADGDPTSAVEKFEAAIEIYRSRGVSNRFVEYVAADKMRALGPRPIHTNISSRSQPAESKVTGEFRKEGEFWTISYQATTFRLKDAKGLHYLAYLIARPGHRIHVYDLIEAVEGGAANGRTTIHAESEDLEVVREIGGPEPAIDARARSEYRTRLRDLHAELDEAERMNDLGRSEPLRAEIEMVGQELTGSLGLGGRARAASGGAERARVLVGRNVRSVMDKIRRHLPALGCHFAAAISTGYFCVYQPELDHPISWQI